MLVALRYRDLNGAICEDRIVKHKNGIYWDIKTDGSVVIYSLDQECL